MSSKDLGRSLVCSSGDLCKRVRRRRQFSMKTQTGVLSCPPRSESCVAQLRAFSAPLKLVTCWSFHHCSRQLGVFQNSP